VARWGCRNAACGCDSIMCSLTRSIAVASRCQTAADGSAAVSRTSERHGSGALVYPTARVVGATAASVAVRRSHPRLWLTETSGDLSSCSDSAWGHHTVRRSCCLRRCSSPRRRRGAHAQICTGKGGAAAVKAGLWGELQRTGAALAYHKSRGKGWGKAPKPEGQH